MNQLKIDSRVFSIHHSDGKAHSTHYWLEYQGMVCRIKNEPDMKLVDWGRGAQFEHGEKMFLAPSSDGYCYFMAELPNMEQYRDGDYYKVPTQTLLDHMASYKSPWEEECEVCGGDGWEENDLIIKEGELVGIGYKHCQHCNNPRKGELI